MEEPGKLIIRVELFVLIIPILFRLTNLETTVVRLARYFIKEWVIEFKQSQQCYINY